MKTQIISDLDTLATLSKQNNAYCGYLRLDNVYIGGDELFETLSYVFPWLNTESVEKLCESHNLYVIFDDEVEMLNIEAQVDVVNFQRFEQVMFFSTPDGKVW